MRITVGVHFISNLYKYIYFYISAGLNEYAPKTDFYTSTIFFLIENRKFHFISISFDLTNPNYPY